MGPLPSGEEPGRRGQTQLRQSVGQRSGWEEGRGGWRLQMQGSVRVRGSRGLRGWGSRKEPYLEQGPSHWEAGI